MANRQDVMIQMMLSLVDYLEDLGLDTQFFFSRHELQIEHLSDVDEVSLRCLYAVMICYSSDVLGREHLGFEFGCLRHHQYLSKVRDEVEVLMPAKLQDMIPHLPIFPAKVLANPCREGLTLQWPDESTLGSYHMVEESMARWLWLSECLTGSKIYPRSISFTHEAIGNTTALEQYFSCPILYETSENGLEVSKDDLALPIEVQSMVTLEPLFIMPQLCH